jgi:hypothetical protein
MHSGGRELFYLQIAQGQNKPSLLVFKGRCSAGLIVTRNFYIGVMQEEKSGYGILQDKET